MSQSVDFRLLGNEATWLKETLQQLPLLLERFSRLAFLCHQQTALDELDTNLWHQARQQFITYRHPEDPVDNSVQLNLCAQPEAVGNAQAIIYLLSTEAVWQPMARHVMVLVPDTAETVDKARGLYTMYRQSGCHISHHNVGS